MGQIATTVKEQVQLLSERGMILDLSTQEIKKILLDIGYYKLGFYWHYFQDVVTHNFSKVHFSDILKLYLLDVKLRHALHRALNLIEVNLKTKIIYYASNKYKAHSDWYAREEYMKSKFVEGLPNTYNEKFKKDNNPIRRHHAKYKECTYAPAWKALEYFTLGSTILLYRNIKCIELKKEISQCYGIRNIGIFQNYLDVLGRIRNICAHNDLIYDYSSPFEIKKSPFIRFNNNNRHSIDSCIKIILYFLGTISDHEKIKAHDEIDAIFKEHINNPVICKIIEEKSKYEF
ncbi:Abi family protein [Ornithobacterium rhinotracheale]|uniref:Abi family protein n=1 Tax=Ornithobacterium rhinotracheale TaxID=28251 RepID=UPI00129C2B97|nr:Abi family protein [Ornithobacterium rhinotracheale]MRJ09235.1 Abi family protein [Ornithobacterium rhinotracheale]UOH78792.1 Abi family protein [Ornithobacterium rhinotracheale]